MTTGRSYNSGGHLKVCRQFFLLILVKRILRPHEHYHNLLHRHRVCFCQKLLSGYINNFHSNVKDVWKLLYCIYFQT